MSEVLSLKEAAKLNVGDYVMWVPYTEGRGGIFENGKLYKIDNIYKAESYVDFVFKHNNAHWIYLNFRVPTRAEMAEHLRTNPESKPKFERRTKSQLVAYIDSLEANTANLRKELAEEKDVHSVNCITLGKYLALEHKYNELKSSYDLEHTVAKDLIETNKRLIQEKNYYMDKLNSYNSWWYRLSTLLFGNED